ncbi:hypothetical protein [Nocardia farcinica]|uniref:hypothetical protein n=1 Tax=Nocardia farcinica TaxID=37329 RepID=UPI001893DFE6|nr:hypothetical protein [Nocardia farcinica]MBF6271699.1 hypothetical protein [Nocardia farcinica]MCZ9325745.1 hypothetical protein [Nocardia farcinica]
MTPLLPEQTNPPNEDALKVLLGLYSSERSDGAALNSAGITQVTAVIAYIGVVATLIGRTPVPSPLVVLAAPIPALILLVHYVVHAYNQGLRATSTRTLEQLMYPWLDQYLPKVAIPADAKHLSLKYFKDREVDLRRVALGINSTEYFFNAARANCRQWILLNVYYLLAGLLVIGFSGVVTAVGLYMAIGQSVAHDWTCAQWALLWTEVGVILAAVLVFLLFSWSGSRHRSRAEEAAERLVEVARETAALHNVGPVTRGAEQLAAETASAMSADSDTSEDDAAAARSD